MGLDGMQTKVGWNATVMMTKIHFTDFTYNPVNKCTPILHFFTHNVKLYLYIYKSDKNQQMNYACIQYCSSVLHTEIWFCRNMIEITGTHLKR